ncbi:hypothetical protein ACJJTC_014366 [Scirpophaga incertulas]
MANETRKNAINQNEIQSCNFFNVFLRSCLRGTLCTMKTLIVFVLSTFYVVVRSRLPIQVYELRENNNNALYVNQNFEEEGQYKPNSLLRLLQPYIYQKESYVDKAANELMAILQKLKKTPSQKNDRMQSIYVIDPNILIDSSPESFEENTDVFTDKTKIEVGAGRQPAGVI